MTKDPFSAILLGTAAAAPCGISFLNCPSRFATNYGTAAAGRIPCGISFESFRSRRCGGVGRAEESRRPGKCLRTLSSVPACLIPLRSYEVQSLDQTPQRLEMLQAQPASQPTRPRLATLSAATAVPNRIGIPANFLQCVSAAHGTIHSEQPSSPVFRSLPKGIA